MSRINLEPIDIGLIWARLNGREPVDVDYTDDVRIIIPGEGSVTIPAKTILEQRDTVYRLNGEVIKLKQRLRSANNLLKTIQNLFAKGES